MKYLRLFKMLGLQCKKKVLPHQKQQQNVFIVGNA